MKVGLPETLRGRSVLKKSIRQCFENWGYLEVDTPSLVLTPGTEVHLGYFATDWRDHKGTPHRLYLRSSPEIHLKKILAAGVPRIFEIAECFRNDGELGPQHRPAFSMLEYYEVGISLDAFITRTEELIRACASQFYQAFPTLARLPLATSFPRFSVGDAFERFAGITLRDEDPGLAQLAIQAGVQSVRKTDDFETAYFKVLMEKIEPALATLPGAVLWNYPPSQAALSRVEGDVARRFEIYLGPMELCNGFDELLDPQENRSRIQQANVRRKSLGKEVPVEDPEFYAALESGVPSCCGNALGVDRLLMALSGAKTIDDVQPFVWGQSLFPDS